MAQPRDLETDLIASMTRFSRPFFLLVGFLLAVIGFAAFAWVHQLREGLVVTGLNRPVFWGIYITNFVFFIGISHAGTLISAILRLCQAEWRRPITRMAETITVLVLYRGGEHHHGSRAPGPGAQRLPASQFPLPPAVGRHEHRHLCDGQHLLSLPAAHSAHRAPPGPAAAAAL